MNVTPPEHQLASYEQSAEEVAANLHSDLSAGLNSQDAQARLARYGTNELDTEAPTPGWKRMPTGRAWPPGCRYPPAHSNWLAPRSLWRRRTTRFAPPLICIIRSLCNGLPNRGGCRSSMFAILWSVSPLRGMLPHLWRRIRCSQHSRSIHGTNKSMSGRSRPCPSRHWPPYQLSIRPISCANWRRNCRLCLTRRSRRLAAAT